MRSRNIKPGFFENEDLTECRFESRILFIGLWLMADSEGKMQYRPKRIKMKLFAADNVMIDECITELAKWEFIKIYVVDGEKYLWIPKFLDHQNPHHREKPKGYPDYCPSLAQGLPQACPSVAGLIPDSLILKTEAMIPDTRETTLSVTEAKPTVKPSDKTPYQKIVDLYHACLPELPRVRKITDALKQPIKARHTVDMQGELPEWTDFFNHVKTCPHLIGQNSRGWRASLAWMIGPKNFAKIMSGSYDRGDGGRPEARTVRDKEMEKKSALANLLRQNAFDAETGSFPALAIADENSRPQND